jgi:hypothetical protein
LDAHDYNKGVPVVHPVGGGNIGIGGMNDAYIIGMRKKSWTSILSILCKSWTFILCGFEK